MFAEHFDMCGVALVELIKPGALISVATGSVFGSIQQKEFGIPVTLSYDPAMFMSRINVHSMWDRLVNWYADFLWSYVSFRSVRRDINALFREKYGDDYPSVHQIGSHSAYVFVNSEPLVDFATPTISKVIYIAGIGAQEPKKLDTHWEELLNKRDRAVLISFGSMVKSIYLPNDVKMAIIETVESFRNVNFIWKYEEDDSFSKNFGSQVYN
ncbi:hypothetical protein PENTCL1PPCAC_16488 [Pristionchus entomophagus]|uniref:glucuronosyltransferase n=1 Tax=Pristionchus entomophagus TaxID=358040 RepID=A0AAV5TJ93_9BILA|nr:hypothetical protein PENTCL1PPCAC_16488 [Pristionchus entomophagus]